MAKSNPHRPFVPDPDQMQLCPEVSGNTINGLGEDHPRRPSMVYWAPDTKDIAHGEMQKYFYQQSAKVPEFGESRAARQAILDAPLPAVARDQVDWTPERWTAGLDQFVDGGSCERTGAAVLQDDWVFEGYDIPQSRVIVLGVAHDYDVISRAPEKEAGLEVIAQYARAASVAKEVAGWIRQCGWAAEPVTGPLTGALALIPPALACGFGELGKHGSIINPEHGASFRLSAVLTDAPFAPTPARDFGIDGFCHNCRICGA